MGSDCRIAPGHTGRITTPGAAFPSAGAARRRQNSLNSHMLSECSATLRWVIDRSE